VPAHPAGERGLVELARRFASVERRVRVLLARAPGGDRRRLLTAALEELIGLRRLDPGEAVAAAYLAAFRRIRSGGEAGAVGDLAGSLARKLDDASLTAQTSAREAFRVVVPENFEEVEAIATTAYIGEDGSRWPLAAYAEMQTRTIGRRATSRGTVDAVGEGFVEVSSHGTTNPVCIELEGERFPAAAAPQPPFHPNCEHILEPV
jgi:hypothetical protein